MFRRTPHRVRRSLRRLAGSLALALMLAAVAAPSARAQGTLGIAATVNDEMISMYDVGARMTLAIYLSKLPDSRETRQRMAPQILRGIIDDKLKMQEAKRQDIAVSLSELSQELSDWEERSGLPKGGATTLANQIGIDKSVITEQVEVGVAWAKLMRAQFLPSIRLSDQEIDDILKEEEARRGQPEYQVSEIYLPFGSAAGTGDAAELADRLIGQIRGGAPFAAVARNFSQSPTAAVGGSLGWVRQGELAPALDQVIQRMQPPQVSAPVRTLDGIYILELAGKRAIEPLVERSTGPETATIYQIHFEFPPNAPADRIQSLMANAGAVGSLARNCEDMAALATQHGTSLSGSPGKLEVSQLSPRLQSAIANLPDLQASPPIAIEGGAIVVMVCERSRPEARKITREELRERIRVRLINERLNLAARQYLRSLRRAAIVDVRI